MGKTYYVYILTNKYNTVLYTGITSDLTRRVYEHKNKVDRSSFTAKYKIYKLVYYENTESVISAIAREKQIKNYSRQKKIDLINAFNPSWEEIILE